eukprot:115879-Pelagomonas_calceolata.AAC.1
MRTLGMGDAMMTEEYKQLIDEKLVLSRELRGAYKHAANAQLISCPECPISSHWLVSMRGAHSQRVCLRLK